MKKMVVIASVFLSSLLSLQPSVASELQNVTITALNINRGVGNFLFISTSTAPTITGCQTNSQWNMILPLDSELSNKIYSALLSAQMSQSKVILGGAGTCNATFGVEILNNFTLLKP